jgi:hypothetical protein
MQSYSGAPHNVCACYYVLACCIIRPVIVDVIMPCGWACMPPKCVYMYSYTHTWNTINIPDTFMVSAIGYDPLPQLACRRSTLAAPVADPLARSAVEQIAMPDRPPCLASAAAGLPPDRPSRCCSSWEWTPIRPRHGERRRGRCSCGQGC